MPETASQNTSTPFISVKNLTKDFTSSSWFGGKQKNTTALSAIDISIHKGERIALLGENGAGKTTLLKMIATAIFPSTGEVSIGKNRLGKDDLAIRSLTGFASNEDRSFYWRLTGRQNLEFFAALHGLTLSDARQRINELFKLFGIDYADKRFDAYSTGMKRKFILIRALLHNPDILLLDEPAKSLDHAAAIEFRKYINKYLDDKRTMILATHNFDEAQYLCNRIIILHNGKILKQGTLRELQAEAKFASASLSDIYLKLVKNV